ncbi:hypothetical protein FA15DRAFT_596428 [Coprinopsis marcescibilis]|uniref:BTB domain-containing protein n=1 Tax=Coprinopsis marcescibilis TaxID=230819 RepID=A0A5C3KPE9_COPMA|nr:hypothetical protein FA15DRAFT_596428 [Coprinopsis marcescibilis]
MKYRSSDDSTCISLRTRAGAVHHINRSVLSNKSGLFSTLLSLPQPHGCSSDALDVWEEDSQLCQLLGLMNGDPIHPASFHELSSLLELAEKWDCTELIHQIRNTSLLNPFIAKHPLQSFALARYFNWTEEAKRASEASLWLDFDDPINAGVIVNMSAEDSAALLGLREKRCGMFQHLLESPQRFPMANGPSYYCIACGRSSAQDSYWSSFKSALTTELCRRPSGVGVLTLLSGGATCLEAEVLWRASCSTVTCGAKRFDKRLTLQLIKACFDVLPVSI